MSVAMEYPQNIWFLRFRRYYVSTIRLYFTNIDDKYRAIL